MQLNRANAKSWNFTLKFCLILDLLGIANIPLKSMSTVENLFSSYILAPRYSIVHIVAKSNKYRVLV